METPYISKREDVLNKRGIVAMLKGNEEEAVELWMQAKKISEKHFDSQVNLNMYRW